MGTMDRLLAMSDTWLQYCIRIHMFHDDKSQLAKLKAETLQDKRIKTYLSDIEAFHSVLVRNHKNPDLPIHKLLFLLNIGLDRSVPEIKAAIDEILKHKDDNGVFQSLTNIPKHYGGMGEDVFGWCLCDSPLLLLALKKAGISYENQIKQGVDSLAGLFQKQGFVCTVSKEHGKFRGPGRKNDCCPYATLLMLRLFAEIPQYKDSTIAKDSIDVLLSLWENSFEKHPYMFFMGTDFRKLKAPSMWYDIVSVADCLSHFDYAKQDKRFHELIAIIKAKQDKNGMFTPESVYQKFKGWDFGQKKVPSPYLTYLCCSILERVQENNEI